MKFVIRRAVAGVILIPLMAVAYTLLYATLVILGGEPTSSIQQVFATGIGIGVIAGVAFQFLHKFIR